MEPPSKPPDDFEEDLDFEEEPPNRPPDELDAGLDAGLEEEFPNRDFFFSEEDDEAEVVPLPNRDLFFVVAEGVADVAAGRLPDAPNKDFLLFCGAGGGVGVTVGFL